VTPKREASRPQNAPRPGSGAIAWARRVPLAIRGACYYVVFLATALVAAPLLADALCARFLPWRLELGALRWPGWGLFAICLASYTACSYWLMSRGRGAYVEFDPPERFVADGPFRWSRNPIAACVLGMLLGEAVGLSSAGVLVLFLLAAPLAHLQVMCLEEPLLARRFGDSYARYLRRTPRWIPRPPRGRTESSRPS